MVNISQTETCCAKFMYSFIKFTTSRRISLNYFPHVAQYFKTCFPFFVIIKLYKKAVVGSSKRMLCENHKCNN